MDRAAPGKGKLLKFRSQRSGVEQLRGGPVRSSRAEEFLSVLNFTPLPGLASRIAERSRRLGFMSMQCGSCMRNVSVCEELQNISDNIWNNGEINLQIFK